MDRQDKRTEPQSATQLKEGFIALISDDLLTPLAAIKAGAELIGKLGHGSPQSGVLQQCVVHILESTLRLTSMVGDLLDISRIEDGCFPVAGRPISLSDFLPDVLRALPLEGRLLELDFDQGLPLAWADPGLLERVVKNLLGAAIRHAPPGSTILVQASATTDQIRVSVTDRGAGIAAEQVPRTLAKIRRRPAGGLGLCLYITRRSVEALGGQLEVQSTPGLGSTFSFTLPSLDGASPNGPPGRAPHDVTTTLEK